MFHYSSYWGTWSRVLSANNGEYVEVNLTPIPCSSDTWENVARIKIRKHGTARGKNDIVDTELPERVKNLMVDNLGHELTNTLLHEDFLPKIDWRLYEKHCNGGAFLSDIMS